MNDFQSETRNDLDIAIVGMAGRFPQANNLEQFWHNLKHGVESIRFYEAKELREQGIDELIFNHPDYVKAGAALEGIDLFDADFFGFSPREAEILDPQHRLFLECAWEALENAGYNTETYRGAIAVYAGAAMNGYLLNLYSNPAIRHSVSPYQLFLANDKDFLATRVSYKLNLNGPSVDVQTACSTSLVAVHLAGQSLLSGECDLALAGGVAIAKPVGYLYQEGGIYSPDGHCRAFDANAQGTVSGSGIGIVVLKRLTDALADGDYIHAVIKGSAINNDGASKVSYTAPSIEAQASVVRTAQAIAEVDPATITYVETHGTGTALGDPIEVTALTQAFRAGTSNRGYCAIGSVKTNIGHLNTAAGIASLIKTVLALKHRQIPPSLHFQQPNPQIDFASSPFYVNTQLTDWQTDPLPRRAGVSSFGIGGTNAHVILEETPVLPTSSPSRPWQLLLLSAKTATALDKLTTHLATHLQRHPDLALADVAYTLQVGRRSFSHRRMVLCQTLEDAVQKLTSSGSQTEPQQVLTHIQDTGHRPITFLFPGQGTQYVNMGRELYETEPIFREQVDRCSKLLKPHLGLDLRDLIYPPKEPKVDSISTPLLATSPSPHLPSSLTQTAYAQPALFTIEYALAQLWISWGIQPESLIGHSIGEYVAACLAGVFSLEDALKLVAVRGNLMQQQPTGAMLAVSITPTELQPWLDHNLELAANNTPNLCVVSGTTEAIHSLQAQLQQQNIPCRLLHTSHAFHSALMDGVQEPFTAALHRIQLHPPQIPFISNVTGTWINVTEATDPAYWAKQLRQPVQFAAGITQLADEPNRIFLEVGAGHTLSTFVRSMLNPILGESASPRVLTSLRHPQDAQSDIALIIQTLGKLWLAGVSVNWSGFYVHEQRHRLPLPTYPFDRQRYWVDLQPESKPIPTSTQSPQIHADPADWFYVPSWERTPSLGSVTPDSLTAQKFRWLIFIDPYGIGNQIARSLEEAGHDVVTVTPGQKFTQLDYRAFAIHPQHRDDYDALLQDLQLRELMPDRIIHLWSLTRPDSTPSHTPHPTPHTPSELGFHSLRLFTQAIAPFPPTSVHLTIVTHHAQEVMGEAVDPDKAMILGLCQVISQEYPHLHCHSVDVERPDDAQIISGLVNALLAEVVTPQTEPMIAFRGGYRWQRTFKPVPLQSVTPTTTRLRSKGHYLIVGEFNRGLGWIFAQGLAATVQANLTLVSQWRLPERESWELWLVEHSSHDPGSYAIRQIQSLESQSAQCQVISADWTNLAHMQAAIAKAEEQFGSLNGVFYCTPMSNAESMALISQLEPTHWDYNIRTKVAGLSVLSEALRDKSIDFCLLQSSLSSIVGGLGLAAYAAANHAIDAFANQQMGRSRLSGVITAKVPWISINWDACQLEDESAPATGMGTSLAELMLTPEQVWEATQRILAIAPSSQVVVSKGGLQTRMEQRHQSNSTQETEATHRSPSDQSHPRPNLSSDYVAPRTAIEQQIAAIWQDLLGLDQVGVQDSFFELGGHSLLAIQAIARLRDLFQVELPMRSLLFEAPTIAGIASVIAEQQSQADDAGTDTEMNAEMAAILDEIRQLSPEEVQAQLTADNQ